MTTHSRKATLLAAVACLTIVTAAPARAQGDVWTIDSNHTSAQFSARHMMVSTVRGKLGKVEGTVRWDGNDVSKATLDATIDVAGLNSGAEGRDKHLRSADFFDVASHPTITFKSTRITPGAGGRFQVVGDLTIRGNTREVTLDVEGLAPPAKMGRSYRTGAIATTKVSRKAFGLLWDRTIETGGAVVGDEINVTIDLELTKPLEAAPSQP